MSAFFGSHGLSTTADLIYIFIEIAITYNLSLSSVSQNPLSEPSAGIKQKNHYKHLRIKSYLRLLPLLFLSWLHQRLSDHILWHETPTVSHKVAGELELSKQRKLRKFFVSKRRYIKLQRFAAGAFGVACGDCGAVATAVFPAASSVLSYFAICAATAPLCCSPFSFFGASSTPTYIISHSLVARLLYGCNVWHLLSADT